MTAEALRAYPDYISYMNQLASAHPHWWYLSDSNVEWGDDARALADYLHAHGETEVRGAISGGWGSLELYDIHYYEIFPKPGRVIPERGTSRSAPASLTVRQLRCRPIKTENLFPTSSESTTSPTIAPARPRRSLATQSTSIV